MPFFCAARASELAPGRMKCIGHQGRKILLANVDGRFYAVDDTCTHEGVSLSRGVLRGEWVKCPLHGSRFNVRTGEVAEDPAEEPLHTFAVRIEGDNVLIGVE